MNKIIINLTIFCLIGVLNNFVNSCNTPNSGVEGSCRQLRDCDSLKQTLQRRFNLNQDYDWQNAPKTTQMSNFLKKYSNLCKDNKVCCGDPLPFEQCGDTTNNNLAGGKRVKINEFNFMAVIQFQKSNKEILSACGGTLISKRYVLTAAHCIKPKRLTLHSIVLGEHTKGIDPDCFVVARKRKCTSSVQTIPVESYVIHPGYNEHTKENDIAIIRLASDADTSQANVKTICIAPPNTEPQGDPLTVTGWGNTEIRTTSGIVASDVLLKIKIKAESQQECERIYSGSAAVVTNKQFCGGNKVGVETCAGDSGGPSFKIGTIPEYPKDPKFIQHGVVSFSKRATCGGNDAFTMYTKVSAYYYWILDNMQP